MYLLFMMILYANDGRLLFSEWMAALVCLGILVIIGAVVYVVYRASVVTLKRQLGI